MLDVRHFAAFTAMTVVAVTAVLTGHSVPASVRMTLLPDLRPLPKPQRIFQHGEISAARLAAGLTPQMRRHFDLFVYVSKAERGPLAQRMHIYQKLPDGVLNPVFAWAASTGREKPEVNARGRHVVTATPAGFYMLDRHRMYPSYHSQNWDQDMPHAMFFDWTYKGKRTGLAIHAASGKDIAKLGSRASGGCVHLAPENAATLYGLVQSYRGEAPRPAHQTNGTSNRGVFLSNDTGALKLADGYRVLVMIEDYGGDAALF
ncbi:MAG TPA: L,D-transpeptidase [Rhizomicrobium sp.]|nr:L,D-transpeptidase [Rhizomicrobium sp.]